MADQLQTIEAIRKRKAQYCRYLDTKQWDGIEAMALPDATLSFFNPDGSIMLVGKTPLTFSTPHAFQSFISGAFATAQTLHMCGPGKVVPSSPDEMKDVWCMEDQTVVNWTAGLLEMRGGGYYHETWKMKRGEWFLKSLRLERTYLKLRLWQGFLYSFRDSGSRSREVGNL
ncbi:hypothetical protein C8A03DRAFT_35478 [Achaetomium macrosporum]|uniref:SnoaL-like domain-containing protein n=1 Tax=Achaetomium macrosporum TaxID=79813 RepID=A0AAN7C7W9_9PEZI|nr:hypothetical protein C8A03DRAFT_35478 [Achaetomium macrosporum]